MLAKVIAWGQDREEAIGRSLRALDEFAIEGIATTIPFQRALLADGRYRRGELHTRFVEQFMGERPLVGPIAGDEQ
jgi:acetyl/propionyl-CoA carboxylase alpha subunit